MSNNEAGRRWVAVVAALGVAAGVGGCTSGGVKVVGDPPQGPASSAAVATAASSAAAGTVVSSPASSTPAGLVGTAGASGPGACAGSALGVEETSPDSSLGHRAYVFVFTNTSSKTCTVSGYPGAAVAAASGKVVLDAQRTLVGYEGGVTKVTTVKLAPGASASAVIEWDVSAPLGSSCPAAAGGHLLITPPNTTTTSTFALPNDLCGEFQTHPVVAGPAGRTEG